MNPVFKSSEGERLVHERYQAKLGGFCRDVLLTE
jgi:hypothetical protein